VDATGWGKFVDQGAFRLLVTFRRRARALGRAHREGARLRRRLLLALWHRRPKGMDPKVVKILHDAFKKAMDDPEHQKVLQQLDQVYWYRSTEDYAKWAAETGSRSARTRAPGLLSK
jgi:hypothetical protein